MFTTTLSKVLVRSWLKYYKDGGCAVGRHGVSLRLIIPILS